MRHKDHQSPLAFSYALALLELANESNSAEAIGQELLVLRQIIDADARFALLLSDPAIGTEARGGLLHRTFDGRASQLMLRFLGLVNQKRRLNLLPSMAGAYAKLLERQQGKIEVDVTVAERLDGQQLDTVRQKIGAALKRDAVVHQYVDGSIIGGLILRVQDRLIDGSVLAQLRAMRQHLLEARPM